VGRLFRLSNLVTGPGRLVPVELKDVTGVETMSLDSSPLGTKSPGAGPQAPSLPHPAFELAERTVAALELELLATTRELQRTVAELQRKNDEVDAFVYIVSHDLRAPLVNVQGFSRELELSSSRLKSLLGTCTLPEPQKSLIEEIANEEIVDALRYISASSSKFERLIDSLLGLSRQGRQVYRYERVDVRAMVHGLVASMRKTIDEAGSEVTISGLPEASADVTALRHVFSNLLSNCFKYRKRTQPLQVSVGGRIDAGQAHYWVQDNGLGIPRTGQARLFQVFQRFHPNQAPGEGMGLAIAYLIVQRHGGRIWAESEEGMGTTVHFSLPATGTDAGIAQ
jgi:signal transduction histidine kinase